MYVYMKVRIYECMYIYMYMYVYAYLPNINVYIFINNKQLQMLNVLQICAYRVLTPTICV
jgi:hypothetical protein